MHQSNRSLNIPPGNPLAFDQLSCPWGRNLTPGCGSGVGHLNVREGEGRAFERKGGGGSGI